MSDRNVDLTVYVRPEVTEPRVARQWSAIALEGLPAGSAGHRGAWLLALVALPCVLALAYVGGFMTPPTLLTGALVESSQDPIAVRLRDGSSIELSARTQLRLLRDADHAVEIELGDGKARFDVTHKPGRVFSVAAGEALVRVVGTRFEVTRLARQDGSIVEVAVLEGVVEVRRRDVPTGVRRLSAGEHWSVFLPRKRTEDPEGQPSSEAVADAAPEHVSADAFERLKESEESEESESAALDEHPEPDSAPRDGRGARHAPGARAKALFARATLARRAGQMREAASAYSELLSRHPRDGRTALSAFELGRIRMDALSDARGAVEAFEAALQLAPTASFREDALARIVFAREALGEHAACRRARASYLASYPTGVHAVTLATRCDATP